MFLAFFSGLSIVQYLWTRESQCSTTNIVRHSAQVVFSGNDGPFDTTSIGSICLRWGNKERKCCTITLAIINQLSGNGLRV
ncbi:hypothetical protein GCK72_011484 [Caenorhabditis remanei]|uniref:Secreted protein n=1 Tax=Caenorhabditis remanei TaxID=31234 RepID=A0A6A5H654_CAERE|nr:hypothetical protein GCK72_011484 [Caenorhabditis remanei]KAF1763218.1 hypothetical protein GCK72_011484 [Caenorhabditis remanei]